MGEQMSIRKTETALSLKERDIENMEEEEEDKEDAVLTKMNPMGKI